MTTIPEFLQPLTKVQPMLAAAVDPEAGGAPSRGDLPGLTLQKQEETNWCWSAVTQAVTAFLDGRSPSQEAIATDHATKSGKAYSCAPPNRSSIKGKQCTSAGACDASCNDPHVLRRILAEQGVFDRVLSSQAPPSFADIQSEIGADRPLPCRVEWDVGGGHFILVAGWSIDASGKDKVQVLDPAHTLGGAAVVARELTYAEFKRYTLSGQSGQVNFSYKVR